MGLSTKQVSSDVHGWNQSLLQASNLEYLPNNPIMKRQPCTSQQQQQQGDKQVLKCPRCESTNTKFCYYNNYNKSQPRHYCKACKRHWTKGGTLRNVPIGGGRKNKRKSSETASKTSSSTSKGASNTSMTIQGHQPPNLNMDNNDENKLSDLQYPYSNLGNFIGTTLTSLHSPSTQVYSSLEETIMMNSNNMSTISSWSIGEGPTSNSSYWDWDDFDKFASLDADLITLPWDDPEIKPW